MAEGRLQVAEQNVGGWVVILLDLVDLVVAWTDASLVGELPLQRIHGVPRDSQEDISHPSRSVGELLYGAANRVHFLTFRGLDWRTALKNRTIIAKYLCFVNSLVRFPIMGNKKNPLAKGLLYGASDGISGYASPLTNARSKSSARLFATRPHDYATLHQPANRGYRELRPPFTRKAHDRKGPRLFWGE
jgi:hypothetical protein